MIAARSILALLSALTVASPSAAAQRTAGSAPQSANQNFVTCDPYIEVMYVNKAVIVGCTDDKAPKAPHSFTVVDGDSPSPEEVIAFVQPYAMTVKILQVMPSSGVQMKTPFQSFNQRVGFYVSDGKITGLRLMTSN